MPYVFLGTIAKGLDTSVGHLGSLFGIAELAGLITFLVGRSIDRGRIRFWMFSGLTSVVAGLALMASAESAVMFAVGFSGVTLGNSLYTVSGHAWIGTEVPFHRRGRVLGLFEMSWALAILVGAPIVGLIIAATTWKAPWSFIGLLVVPLGVWLSRTFPRPHPDSSTVSKMPPIRVTRVLILTLATTPLVSFGATAMFSTYGAWLADRFGLSVRAIGILSIAIGGAELLASYSTMRFSDRWGKARSAVGGIVLMAIGALAVAVTPKVPAFGIAALVLVFLGFEFGLICMLSLISEVGGDSRGTAITVNAALSTVARALAAALGTTIYASAGMPATGAMTIFCSLLALGCLVASQRGSGNPAG